MIRKKIIAKIHSFRLRRNCKCFNYNNSDTNSRTLTIVSILIGILTVVISLSNLYLYYNQLQVEKLRAQREQPNLVVTQLGGDPSLHFKLLHKEDKWTEYPYRVMLFCRLENLSEKPITITFFDLESEINTLRSDSIVIASNTKYELYNVYDEDGRAHYGTYNIGKDQLLPLLVLEPWGAKEGTIFFIGRKDMSSDKITAKLKVTTTRGTFSTNVTIHKASSYYSRKLNDKQVESL